MTNIGHPIQSITSLSVTDWEMVSDLSVYGCVFLSFFSPLSYQNAHYIKSLSLGAHLPVHVCTLITYVFLYLFVCLFVGLFILFSVSTIMEEPDTGPIPPPQTDSNTTSNRLVIRGSGSNVFINW